jgi:hypothetical protein
MRRGVRTRARRRQGEMCRGLPSLCRKLLNAGQVIAKHDSPVIGSLALLPRCSTAAAAPGVDARDYPGPAGHPTLSARRSEPLPADFYFSAKQIDASSFYAQVAGFFGKLIAPSQYFVTCLFSKTTRRAWAGNLSSYKNCWRRACGADRRRIHTNASRPCGKDASATVSLARGGRVWRRHSHDQKAQARVLSRDGEYRWPRTAEGYEGQALCSGIRVRELDCLSGPKGLGRMEL